METISQCLKSSKGQNKQDGVSEGSDEAHSDSGDSIFITQRSVPEPVRTKRQRAQDFQSDFRSRGGPAFYEDETSPSNSNKESKSGKKKKTYKLPKYRFSCVNETEGQGSMALLPIQNQRLHNYAMGGFFNCVQELWNSYQKGENQMPPLPTVEMDWEYISPISEEDDEEKERMEDGDFKIVGKKQFVVSLKPKISQPCYVRRRNEVRQQTSTPSTAGSASKEKQRGTKRKATRITLSQETESSDDGEVPAQTETPQKQKCPKKGKKKINFNEEENADEVGSNSDAALCLQKVTEAAVAEPHADISQMGNAECEPESQNLPQGDANNGALCSETRVKKKGKKDYESVLEGSREEAEGQRAAPSVKEAVAEVDEAPRPSQAADELDSKWKEKKRKNKCAVEDTRKEVDGQCDERVEVDTAVSLNVENSGKKNEKNVNDHVDIETGMAEEPQHNDGNMPKEMKKKKMFNKTSDVPQPTTGHVEDVEDCLENPETAQETLPSGSVKRKKKKKPSTFKDATEVGEDVCIDVDRSSDGITVTGNMDLLVKKKSISERVHVSYTPGQDETVDDTLKKTEALDADLVTEKKKKKKKKKKRKMKEPSNMIVSEDTASQSECLASAQKNYKSKTSSFLVADEEEKAGQRHGDKHACHGGGAETPDVSISHLATTSTDMAASLEEGGIKKKKRSAVRDGVERETDFEEPKKTSPGTLPEAGIEEKKKRKRHKSKVTSPMEGWESAAGGGQFETDDAVVFRKNEKTKQNFRAAAEDTDLEKHTPNTCSSLSPKKKGKHGRSAETLIDIILDKDHATTETLFEHTLPSSSTLGLGDARLKKKKENRDDDEHLVRLKSFTETTETEVYESKQEKSKKQAADCSFVSAVPDTSVTQLETSSSSSIRKNKVKKAKRTLHNPSEEFLTYW